MANDEYTLNEEGDRLIEMAVKNKVQDVKDDIDFKQKVTKNVLKNQLKNSKGSTEGAGEGASKAASAGSEAASGAAKAAESALESAGESLASSGEAVASNPYFWEVVGIICIILYVILLCYGAVLYFNVGLEGTWKDDYESKYQDDAEKALEMIDTGALFLDNDMLMLSREDVKRVLKHTIDYNEDLKFEADAVGFYHCITVKKKGPTITIGEGENKRTLSLFYFDFGPMVFGRGGYTDYILSYSQLFTMDTSKSEPYGLSKYYDGEFKVKWRTLLALCEMLSEKNYEKYGSDEDGWMSEEGLDNDLNFKTDMDGYFLTDEQIDNLCTMFDYQIVCYPDDENGLDYVQIAKKNIDEETYEKVLTSVDGDPDKWFRTNYTLFTQVYSIEELKERTYRLPRVRMPDGSYQEMSSFYCDADGNLIDEDDLLKRTSDYVDAYGEDYVLSIVGYKDLRIPSLAPVSVSNAFISAKYGYVKEENILSEYGADRCDSLTVTVDAYRLVNYIKQIIPDFTFEHFLTLLSLIPGSEEEMETWKNYEALYIKGEEMKEKYLLQKESGVDMGITEGAVRDAYKEEFVLEDFSGKGTFVGSLSKRRTPAGESFTGIGDQVYIGTHITGGGIKVSYNDWFKVSRFARSKIDKSDCLEIDEIDQMLKYACNNLLSGGVMGNNAKTILTNDDERAIIAEELYWYQEDNPDFSISALLAIMIAEDNTWEWAETGGSGKKNKRTPEEMGQYICREFDDIKGIINKNMGGEMPGTFFDMEFGIGFDCTEGTQEAYEKAEIMACFIHWWEDKYFPAAGPGVIYENSPDRIGWCNLCAQMREGMLNASGKTSNNSLYFWPLALAYHEGTKVTSAFGPRYHPITGEYKTHGGLDIGAPSGTDILAVAAGTVVNTGYEEGGAGNFVNIKHNDGNMTKYFHMLSGSICVSVGDYVMAGQVIGKVGSTGASTGPHLHIEVWEDGNRRTDPAPYIGLTEKDVETDTGTKATQ